MDALFENNEGFGPGGKLADLRSAVPDGYGNANPNWKGQAAVAAGAAVGRVSKYACAFVDLGLGPYGQVSREAAALARAKASIDELVSVIESGDLYVTDNWTVLVRPTPMEPDMAKLMALAAQGFQTQLNGHLTTLGLAEHRLASPLVPDSLFFGQMENDLAGAPKDAVPGLLGTERARESAREAQQLELVRHMQGTVTRKETMTRDGKPVTRLTMLDGSKQVYRSDETGETTEFYDSGGKLYSTRKVQLDGETRTELMRDGKSPVVITESKGGGDAKAVVDGVTLTIPSHSDIASALAGGGVSGGVAGLNPYVRQPPFSAASFLSAGEAASVEAGMGISGPGLAVLGTAVAVGMAEDDYTKCVAGYQGGAIIAGEVALMLAGPELRPVAALGVSTATSLATGAIGTAVGKMMCQE
ncbi:hypothetical protein [Gordonia sp. GN26]